ncbi:MAG: chemotaxis protein CheB [Rhizomicrobium sp.]
MPKSRPHRTKKVRARPSRRPAPLRVPKRTTPAFPIVGIGASAGGLEACRKLIGPLSAGNGMAFILVQHLDPTHESMMVDLLASHTAMKVLEAKNGMPIERDHLYVIPPGTYLSVAGDALQISKPAERHGARMPFDFLLYSLAAEYGPRAVGVILSGTGSDGSLGLKALKEKGGLVIAQDPSEARYDGMPRNAIKTGAVDDVLAVEKIAAALVKYAKRTETAAPRSVTPQKDIVKNWLPEVIKLLRTKTDHDFTLYKDGTLQRRIERRMGMAAIRTDDKDRYIAFLRSDATELDLLAKDLLINVTSFFRDPKVFEFLTKKTIPDLIADHASDQSIRVWIAGCSTGEETYSFAMLLNEQIAKARSSLKLQVLASDVDPDAIACARDGLYPESIKEVVSPERLARFFVKEGHSYRVSPELRSSVVFTVHDVLADPPFSRLDIISCRNLLIYLRPEAQAKVVSHFHFALRKDGILVLGSSESLSNDDARFEVISKAERIYRHVGRSWPGEIGFPVGAGLGVRAPARTSQGQTLSRQAVLAELCRRMVMENYAPAAVLINSKYECLYSLGPTDRYLHVAPGYPSHDLLAMVRQDMRTKLRSAIQRASLESARIVVAGGRTSKSGDALSFSIAVQSVVSEGEALLLICFIDEPKSELKQNRPVTAGHASEVAGLERELEAARAELEGAIRNLEISGEEQRAINEEALSVNEENQSTNEELLASKEELQSLNEELTALNTQLQETLELQRTTSDDLQNVLYSTDVATLFLDTTLKIRFFTPATKLLFNVIPTDIGRPLADLSSLTADGDLLTDARTVLQNLVPIEREIEARSGAWYVRRVLPYRTQDNTVGGVIITFVDSTERRRAADALELAKRQAEQANIAKSRFLAAASHDLRQPLQTLALLQGQLANTVEGRKAQRLVDRLDETLGAISGMLNALLDINQIEAGTVHAEMIEFPINDLLDTLRDEFTYLAEAQGLEFHVVRCGLSIRTDPRLLEQMIRNLLSNALKFTLHGKVLLGCRRRAGLLSIEVLDTGIGIPGEELRPIFEEYHQLGNAARERSRGLGLGLSIVQRLGNLLGHRVAVASEPGKGSVFAIEVKLPARELSVRLKHKRNGKDNGLAPDALHHGTILVVEDDPEVRELLDLILKEEGHHTALAADGIAALDLVTRGIVRPDILLADYNLPHGMNGLQVAAKLREILYRQLPVIILTGDITTGTLREVALQNCIQLNKPVKLRELMQTIQRLLPISQSEAEGPAPQPAKDAASAGPPAIFVVDDDRHIRDGVRGILEGKGHVVEDFATCEAFLEAFHPGREACLLIDASLPGMDGFELLQRLHDDDHSLPAIMITGYGDVPMAVRAMKAGALDFLEKPISANDLLASVERALEHARDSTKLMAWQEAAANRIGKLTARQQTIMEMVLAGNPSKNIAADLGISQRTVENHRASIMKKTGAKSLPALARLALAAGANVAS